MAARLRRVDKEATDETRSPIQPKVEVRAMIRTVTLSMLYFASMGVLIAAYGLLPIA